jgi:hypothetical protein
MKWITVADKRGILVYTSDKSMSATAEELLNEAKISLNDK